MKIVAKGNKNNKKVTVTAEMIEGEWIIDVDDAEMIPEFYAEMESRHPIGGTCFPERQSGLFVIATMQGTWFFDDTNTEITTLDFDEELPNEEGEIY